MPSWESKNNKTPLFSFSKNTSMEVALNLPIVTAFFHSSGLHGVWNACSLPGSLSIFLHLFSEPEWPFEKVSGGILTNLLLSLAWLLLSFVRQAANGIPFFRSWMWGSYERQATWIRQLEIKLSGLSLTKRMRMCLKPVGSLVLHTWSRQTSRSALDTWPLQGQVTFCQAEGSLENILPQKLNHSQVRGVKLKEFLWPKSAPHTPSLPPQVENWN